MKNFTPEMIEKAKAAKTEEELLEIAKAGGMEMTADEAATYFAQLNPQSGELDDDDLDNVAGGACVETYLSTYDIAIGTKIRLTNGKKCSRCGGVEGVISIGDPVSGETRAAVNCPIDNIRIVSSVKRSHFEYI